MKSCSYSWRWLAEGILQVVLFTVFCFRWSVKNSVAKILLAIWEIFLFENNCYYNSYKFSYKFTFTSFFQKQESNFQQVVGLVTKKQVKFNRLLKRNFWHHIPVHIVVSRFNLYNALSLCVSRKCFLLFKTFAEKRCPLAKSSLFPVFLFFRKTKSFIFTYYRVVKLQVHKCLVILTLLQPFDICFDISIIYSVRLFTSFTRLLTALT